MYNQSYFYKITAPDTAVKTKRDYFWVIPQRYNPMCRLILNNQGTGFKSWKSLLKTLGAYYQRNILNKAGIDKTDSLGSSLSLRTIRAYHATEWVKLITEYKIMKW